MCKLHRKQLATNRLGEGNGGLGCVWTVNVSLVWENYSSQKPPQAHSHFVFQQAALGSTPGTV